MVVSFLTGAFDAGAKHAVAGTGPAENVQDGAKRPLVDCAGHHLFGLSAFVVYATFRTFEGKYYEFQNYLSPFYSPTIVVSFEMFGHKIHVSPALWILPFPLIFRFTCYYYRKAYYRAFFWDPPACAVGEAVSRKDYSGESRFPLVLQNVHRYAWYFTVIIIAILWWDTLRGFCVAGRFQGWNRICCFSDKHIASDWLHLRMPRMETHGRWLRQLLIHAPIPTGRDTGFGKRSPV